MSRPAGRPELGLLGRILLRLSDAPLSHAASPPADSRPTSADEESNGDDPLARLLHVYPDLVARLEEKRVLDFGCGSGDATVALAERARASVVGLDILEPRLEAARARAQQAGVTDRARFLAEVPDGETFDWIVSQNSMEHFADPRAVLETMVRHLEPDGRILITFCPTWLSPYGAHMRFFTPVPWVHLLFPERTVMAVRARFRDDGAMRYEDVEGGLNRMTVRRFERLVREAGLVTEFEGDEYVRDLSFLGRFPPTSEFFTNRVTRVLKTPGSAA